MLAGLFLLLLSFLPWFFDFGKTPDSGMLFAIAWGMGYVLVCNSIIVKYTKKKPKYILRIPHAHILIVGAISAIIIEFFGNWIWKLWYYPQFSTYFYLSAMLFIQIVYFYFILKGYIAIRAMLIAHGFSKKPVKYSRTYRGFFNVLGILGCFGFAIGIFQVLGMLNYTDLSFFNSFRLTGFNAVNVLLISCSLVFILEFLEYREREDTFLLHLIKGDWTPLVAILVASLLTAITMEGFNVPLSVWLYTNWPYPDIAIAGLPLTVLIAWPIQYVLLISIYRAFYKKETATIWY